MSLSASNENNPCPSMTSAFLLQLHRKKKKQTNAKFYYLVDEGDTKMFFTIVTNSKSIMPGISVNLELTRPQNL